MKKPQWFPLAATAQLWLSRGLQYDTKFILLCDSDHFHKGGMEAKFSFIMFRRPSLFIRNGLCDDS